MYIHTSVVMLAIYSNRAVTLSIYVSRVEFTLDDHGDVVWSTPPGVEVDGLFLTSSYRVSYSPTHSVLHS